MVNWNSFFISRFKHEGFVTEAACKFFQCGRVWSLRYAGIDDPVLVIDHHASGSLQEKRFRFELAPIQYILRFKILYKALDDIVPFLSATIWSKHWIN